MLIGKTHWGVATTDHLPYRRGWHAHIGYLGGGEAYWTGHECTGGDGSTNCHTFTDVRDMAAASPVQGAQLMRAVDRPLIPIPPRHRTRC